MTECAQLINDQSPEESKRVLIDNCLCLEIDCAIYEAAVETMTSITHNLLEAQTQNESNITLLKAKSDRLIENDLLVVSLIMYRLTCILYL